jgi:tight adherence protein B
VKPLVMTLLGTYGVWLVYTALAYRWRGVLPGPRVDRPKTPSRSAADWLAQAGLGDVGVGEFVGVLTCLFILGAIGGLALFGGPVPALASGAFAATFPVASYRARRERRQAEAREAWPRLIEEIRLLTGSLGRSIPQALFDVGRGGPDELRSAFADAEREWLLSTDFPRTLSVLKARLADPSADAVCETLLVAHELGGTDLDRRLAALADDRMQDLQGRKDGLAKQAGVRFARRFVLLVPVGMSLAGLSIGTGRAAYQTATGQTLVLVGLIAIGGCWWWAGRLMRLPQEQRVFHG